MPCMPDWVTSKQEQSAGTVRVVSMSTAEVALHRLYSVTDVIDGRAAVVVGVATEDPGAEVDPVGRAGM